ncbi:MAG: long-chain fatty acid--CoA ligase [Armatimonadota bacterium]
MPRTLGQLLTEAAAKWPQRPAVAMGEVRLSYAELDALASRAAAGLAALGVQPGDRVAVMLPNCPYFPISLFAIARAGGVVVPINPTLTPAEAGFVLADSGAQVLLTIAPLRQLAEAVRPNLPDLQHLLFVDEAATEAPAQAPPLPEVAPEDLAVIFYTSGTTGRPKGAMLSHHNLVFDADACTGVLPLSEEDNFCCVLPYFHSFGATVCMILPVLVGACMTMAARFAPRETLRLIETERCTLVAGVPAMYGLMLSLKPEETFHLSSLRIVVSGGAPLALEVAQGFAARFGVELLEGYGPTEASPVVSCTPAEGAHKPGSVGPPLPGVEVRIVDEQGREAPLGEVGEIVVRGQNVMQGYYRQPEATAATVRDGWLYTGDLGRLDEDGYLYIAERKKDLVIVGGLNVYPREVEEVVHQHPAVAEAAVIGVPCPLRGEAPVACVVLADGQQADERELIDHCQERLAPFKVPRRVVLYEELPRSATGKALKRELREIHADILSRRQARPA